MKTFQVSSKFGAEFAFNCETLQKAIALMNKWATRHSYSGSNFSIGETVNPIALHDEYVAE
jgi:hypothetical protein